MKRSPLTHDSVFSDEDYARRYADGHHKMAEGFGREYSKKLSERGLSSGRILDAGCGSGGTCITLAQSLPDVEVIGIDLSKPLLEIASHYAKQEGVEGKVKFEKCDVQQISYEDDNFDVVLNINMAHLVEKPIQMLDELERVLRPKGALYIRDLRRSFLGLIENEIKSAYSMKEVKDLFLKSRLRSGKFSSSVIYWKFEA